MKRTRKHILIVLVSVLVLANHFFPDLLGRVLLGVVDVVGYVTLIRYILRKGVFEDGTNNN